MSKNPVDIQRFITHLERGRHAEDLPLICLTVSGKERWLALTLSLQGDGRCEINYHDNGKGIDENISDQIFQPFFTTSRGNEETSGLGLYAIDNIVKNLFHGGLEIQQGINADKPGFHLHIELPKLQNESNKQQHPL